MKFPLLRFWWEDNSQLIFIFLCAVCCFLMMLGYKFAEYFVFGVIALFFVLMVLLVVFTLLAKFFEMRIKARKK